MSTLPAFIFPSYFRIVRIVPSVRCWAHMVRGLPCYPCRICDASLLLGSRTCFCTSLGANQSRRSPGVHTSNEVSQISYRIFSLHAFTHNVDSYSKSPRLFGIWPATWKNSSYPSIGLSSVSFFSLHAPLYASRTPPFPPWFHRATPPPLISRIPSSRQC